MWNSCGNDESRAPISEQCKKDRNDEDGAFKKIVAHSVNGLVDQYRAIVLRLKLNIVRQLLLNLGQTRFHSLSDFAAVFTGKQHRCAADCFLTVDCRCPRSDT